MAYTPIQNCEVLQCPKQWDALQELGVSGVRLCGRCQKHVYLCQTSKEAARHAQEGHCIAVPGWFLSPQDFPDEDERLQALSRQHGVPHIRLRDHELDPAVLRLVPPEVATRHWLIPVRRVGDSLIVAMRDPANSNAIDDMRFLTGCTIEVVVASPREIEEALERVYPPTVVY
jgi:hypothetical protein